MDALEESVYVSVLVTCILLQVSMLPHIDSNDWDALHINNTMHERIVLVICLSDQKTAILGYSKPDPSRKHSALNSPPECFFKALEICEVLGDCLSKGTHGSVLCVIRGWAKLAEHQIVVVDTA